mgnify:FL=1
MEKTHRNRTYFRKKVDEIGKLRYSDGTAVFLWEHAAALCLQGTNGDLEGRDSMDHFVLHSEFQPMGDQPQAIQDLVKGFREGNQFETLLGVTGSGKTFTMANVIQALNKPTLIISHNKTLAGQLYGEMKEFFPENAVEYFVSYYDYYQPEAYVPSTDTYIEKDADINDEIDKLRHLSLIHI